ncbi:MULTISPECIES: hypothetical protein [Arcobacteraceae]|uniref:Uncharacterized protein n=1 Tax=Poseidonibacter parvus TaxID=1850254 RepID=A0A1P8KJ50_9BACT|nr:MULTISPECIES: hypothetical protein [Arcobacteraceae]APW64564.1 hypothetical protein LPB137_01285 [Poseidonibacter parvus]
MSLVSNKNKKVFLCTNTKIATIEKVDIILSPEFYWVRIFDIPVKNIMQARHVLPTLFEDILENITNLSYQVIKLEENKYLCFAYINKKIYDVIKQSGISLSLVNGVYFAQNECKKFTQFNSDGKSFMYSEDGILIKVPKLITSNSIDLSEKIDSIELSSNKVNIKLYNNLLTSKQIYSILFVLISISILNIYKIIDYKKEVEIIDKKIEKIKIESNLPKSLLQTKAILKSNSKKLENEISKRDFLEYILVKNKIKIKTINLKAENLSLILENSNKKDIEDYISKKYKILSSNINGKDLNIRIKL